MSQFVDDTITIQSNDLTGKKGMALAAIMANEIYFLPAFLDHYRALGIERFFLLDDGSTDGTREFAAKEPDVMLLGSAYRYGQMIDIAGQNSQGRAALAWRNTIPARFARGEWHLQLDLDEFLALPAGVYLPDVTKRHARADLIWATMVDLYPKTWAEIDGDRQKAFNAIDWYFDAIQHYRIDRTKSQPTIIYSGARARLHAEFLPNRDVKEKRLNQFKRRLRRNPYPRVNNNLRPALLRWHGAMYFRTPHLVENARRAPMMLALAHYKFAPNFAQKLRFAFERGGHYGGGSDYKMLEDIYAAMQQQNAGFLGAVSRPFHGYEDFAQAKIAFNLPKPSNA